MMGEELIPLNQLKSMDQELYMKYAAKYYDHPARIKLLERKIPALNCLWNDVVHLLPLHPSLVYSELKRLGVNIGGEKEFYKIPVTNLQADKTVIYTFHRADDRGPDAAISEESIKLLDPDEYEEYENLPKDTVDYFQEECKKGKRFGMFQFIPHVLCLGKVNISNAEIIRWGD